MRFGYWNYVTLGPWSQWAAEAAECAADQGRYWEYHELLFKSQATDPGYAFDKNGLKMYASTLGLDIPLFSDCLDSGKYASLMQADTQKAASFGVRNTPMFLINGRPLIGDQPFEVFQQFIDPLLQ